MAKVRYHLAPQGPDICRADPSNPKAKGCPYGGESGSENHFNTMAEAEAAYEQKMESEGNGLVAASASAAKSSSGSPQTALGAALTPVYRKKWDAIASDSYFGLTRTDSGYVADSSESLLRAKDEFILQVGYEADPEVEYEEGSDGEVVRSVYIAELDLEISNQNVEDDMDELREYRTMMRDQERDYWSSTF